MQTSGEEKPFPIRPHILFGQRLFCTVLWSCDRTPHHIEMSVTVGRQIIFELPCNLDTFVPNTHTDPKETCFSSELPLHSSPSSFPSPSQSQHPFIDESEGCTVDLPLPFNRKKALTGSKEATVQCATLEKRRDW